MKSRFAFAILALGVFAIASPSAGADTAAEMLEKGIYNEETVGNLDEAIEIYRKVVSAANQAERLAANAQYRLARCLLKQQKKAQAIEAFQAVVDNYPKHKEFVDKAREHLPAKLQLREAPWKDGERLTLTMKLPGGQPVGIVGTGVHSEEVDGKPVWKMLVRRFVGSSQNEGVSTVIVDKATNRPLQTNWNHTMLGNAQGTWTEDQLQLSLSKHLGGEVETKTVELDAPAYANDQWFFGFRQLPLTVGYQATLPIRVAFTGGNPVELEIQVEEKEKVTTPVGEFDCFRIDTNISQTFWIADVPERYVVRFVAGGVDAVLTSISTGQQSVTLHHASLGCSVTAPTGWFPFEPDPSNEHEATFILVAPGLATAVVSIKDKNQLSPEDRQSVEAWAESKIERARRAYKSFSLREGTRKPVKIAGVEGITFVEDHVVRDISFTGEIILALTPSRSIAMSASMRKETYDEYRTALESLRASISVK